MPNPVSTSLPNPVSYDTSVTGVVLDRVTGLAWQRALDTTLYTQAEAASFCAANRLDGRTDWRVPTVLELTTLVDFTQPQLDPDIDPVAFPNTPNDNTASGRFVTSTPVAGDSTLNWFVRFQNGDSRREAAGAGRVRCVRIGDPVAMKCYASDARFSVATGTVATVLDAATGLTWQRGNSPTRMMWSEALAYCAGLPGGFRLPSLKEMQTIVNYGVAAPGPMIDVAAFPVSTEVSTSPFFWTSSRSSGLSNSSWMVHFGMGFPSWIEQYASLYARCVRTP